MTFAIKHFPEKHSYIILHDYHNVQAMKEVIPMYILCILTIQGGDHRPALLHISPHN